ncbi:MAG: ATP synthase F1 subunit delta [Phycisphaeraceae bacterium]
MTDRIESLHAGALAETYARPLFQLAEQAGMVDSVREQLDEILELLDEHPDLAQIFRHQAIDPDRRAATIEKLFSDRADELVVRFLLVLNAHHRLGELASVRQAYDQMVKASRNQVDVAVYTAQPLDEEQEQAVADRLTKSLGREAIIHTQTDPKIIGGMRIRFEDKLIDASVASQLRRMTHQIATQGHEAVRAAAGSLLVETKTNGQHQ